MSKGKGGGGRAGVSGAAQTGAEIPRAFNPGTLERPPEAELPAGALPLSEEKKKAKDRAFGKFYQAEEELAGALAANRIPSASQINPYDKYYFLDRITSANGHVSATEREKEINRIVNGVLESGYPALKKSSPATAKMLKSVAKKTLSAADKWFKISE